jgi:hypothetical protein
MMFGSCFGTNDFLFKLFERRLSFPPGTIVFDNLLHIQASRQIFSDALGPR